MKTIDQKFKVVISYIKKRYFLLVIAGCLGFVGIIAIYKLFIVKPTYIYVKVKVGQGYWWAATQRPSLWFVKAIEQAKEQKDLSGIPAAKILDIFYYPYYGSGQYDIYVTARLKVSKVGSVETYNFNRETIGVSTPIDLEFPQVQFSGTIINLSEKPFKDTFEYKVITLYRKSINPWEYEQIHVGSSFTEGNVKLLEILSKERGETNDVLLSDFGKMINSDIEPYRYARVRVRMRVKKDGDNYIFGEEMIVGPGRGIPIVIDNFPLNDFTITNVE